MSATEPEGAEEDTHPLTQSFHGALLDAWYAWEEGRIEDARADTRRAEAYTNKRLNGDGSR